MNRQLHRFGHFDTSAKILADLHEGKVRESLRGVAEWLRAAVDASGRADKCCRNVMYHDDGRATWLYPNSNTAELISAWLDLSELLEDGSLVARATDYADGLLNDPMKGLYRGPDATVQGLPWYWTDGGTYGGLYAMRLPYHFDRLHQLTGEARYREICDVIGKTLLGRQLDSGLVSAAWGPEEGWMTEIRIGSRYVYAVATFATLWRITGEAAYLTAYERAVAVLLRMQNADGSFFQMYEPRTAQSIDTSVKLHFVSYLLNAFEEAYEVTGDERLVECGRRLSDHLAGVYYYRQAVPYCTGHVGEAADRMEAESAIQDASAGLFWLAKQTGAPVYRDVALKLWMQTWMHQLPLDAAPGWRGAIIRGVNPALQETISGVPTNRKHLHYDPSIIGRCDLWFAVHHVFASRRLLEMLADKAKSPSLGVTETCEVARSRRERGIDEESHLTPIPAGRTLGMG